MTSFLATVTHNVLTDSTFSNNVSLKTTTIAGRWGLGATLARNSVRVHVLCTSSGFDWLDRPVSGLVLSYRIL